MYVYIYKYIYMYVYIYSMYVYYTYIYMYVYIYIYYLYNLYPSAGSSSGGSSGSGGGGGGGISSSSGGGLVRLKGCKIRLWNIIYEIESLDITRAAGRQIGRGPGEAGGGGKRGGGRAAPDAGRGVENLKSIKNINNTGNSGWKEETVCGGGGARWMTTLVPTPVGRPGVYECVCQRAQLRVRMLTYADGC
jgi:hypothetical protein